MESEIVESHKSLQRAIDTALWMNFKYRKEKRSYQVVHDKKTKLYQVVPQKGRRRSSFIEKPENYLQMSYKHIESIRYEVEPLPHWEVIMGLFSSIHGDILRFIIMYQVPIEKLIRYELACRGHDKNSVWIGFDKALEVWLE